MYKLIFILFLSPSFCFSQSETRFQLSAMESKVSWEGKDFAGAGRHEGTIQLTSGFLAVNGNQVKGDFELDMKTIRDTDIKDERGRKDLEEHLRSEDFFAVDQFPKAFFSITTIEPPTLKISTKPERYTVTGFLGIKGITNTISFPAVIELSGQSVRAQAVIIIDRTKWNVNYQSKTVFNSLKDGILSDDIKVTLDLLFKSK